MARKIASIIEDISQPKTAVESSISTSHDVIVTQHGLGLDINQFGSIVHIDHSQFEQLKALMEPVE